MVVNHQIKTSLEFSLTYVEHCSVFQLILMGIDSFGSFSLAHSQAAKQVNSFNLSSVAGRAKKLQVLYFHTYSYNLWLQYHSEVTGAV